MISLDENQTVNVTIIYSLPNKRTAVRALLFLQSYLQNMDNGRVTGVVFLDLRKAFDFDDHTILIRRLKNIGVTGKSLPCMWFNSYLSGRCQQTMCGDVISLPANITMRVPQGSIFGLLLFFVYINVVLSVLKHSKMTICAVDMAFYCPGISATDLHDGIKVKFRFEMYCCLVAQQ